MSVVSMSSSAAAAATQHFCYFKKEKLIELCVRNQLLKDEEAGKALKNANLKAKLYLCNYEATRNNPQAEEMFAMVVEENNDIIIKELQKVIPVDEHQSLYKKKKHDLLTDLAAVSNGVVTNVAEMLSRDDEIGSQLATLLDHSAHSKCLEDEVSGTRSGGGAGKPEGTVASKEDEVMHEAGLVGHERRLQEAHAEGPPQSSGSKRRPQSQSLSATSQSDNHCNKKFKAANQPRGTDSDEGPAMVHDGSRNNSFGTNQPTLAEYVGRQVIDLLIRDNRIQAVFLGHAKLQKNKVQDEILKEEKIRVERELEQSRLNMQQLQATVTDLDGEIDDIRARYNDMCSQYTKARKELSDCKISISRAINELRATQVASVDLLDQLTAKLNG